MDQSNAVWQQGLEYDSLSDIGLRRGNNQDNLAVDPAGSEALWRQRGHLFMVADGMGAHAAGELASKLAVDMVPLAYRKLTDRSPAEALLAAVQEANTQIHERGQASLNFRGMGTTCTTLVLLPEGALVAHVGDSRAYRLRGNRLDQLTFDHSLIWEMRATGQLQGQVPDYIPKNVITRSLGPSAAVQIDMEGPFPVAQGDTFLLCSDGLSGQVKDEEIGTLLRCLPPAEAVRALVDLANLRGGPDNISVIVARASGPEITAAANADFRPAAVPRKARPVSTIVWVALGVLGLAGVLLLLLEQWLWAIIALGGALLAGTIAFIQRYGDDASRLPLEGRPLGRGPYASIDCKPTAEVVGRLADIVRQLREATNRVGWSVDWNRFNGHVDQAAAANQGGDHAQAVEQYCQAMSFMMDQLRQQKRAGNGSS